MTTSSPYEEIIYSLLTAYQEEKLSTDLLHSLKKSTAKDFKISMPQNSQLVKAYYKLLQDEKIEINQELLNLIQKRKIRSLSGVSVITILTKPYDCPGKCIYCPTQPDIPKSYLSNEPAVMRALLNSFDPYKQIISRLRGLTENGHPTGKIEIIIIGGSFTYLPEEYRDWYIYRVYQALNDGLNYDPSTMKDYYRPVYSKSGENKVEVLEKYDQTQESIVTKEMIEKEQQKNETATHRCVSLNIETRPDLLDEKEVKLLRFYGVTKIEIGVQSTDEEVQTITKRGHTVEQAKQTIKLLKDSALKIGMHMMLNLPGSNLEKDYKMMQVLFDDIAFKPDFLKIYPCVVTENSELTEIYKKGEFNPYTDDELIHLIGKIKQNLIPRYCRVMRVIRDIPAESIIGGSQISNLREFVKKASYNCQCVRCREVRNRQVTGKIELCQEIYDSSEGQEYFLSFEDLEHNLLYSLLRLRLPNKKQANIFPVLQGAALIREVHSYGRQVVVDAKGDSKGQHKGFGKKLMEQAEKIAREKGYTKMAVIAGVGVRQYYQKMGYQLVDSYMVKQLVKS